MTQLQDAIAKHRNTIDQPVIVVIGNPLKPEIKEHDFVEKGGTVAQHLECYDLVSAPCLILYNSEPLLEIDWNTTTLDSGDVLTIIKEPGAIAAGAIALWVIVVITLLTTAYSIYTILTLDSPDPGESGDSPNYSVGYSGNRARPGAPMPVVYGNIRTYPDISGQFTIYENNEQLLYQLFDVTLGYIQTITPDEIFFEETPLRSFSDFEIEHVEPNAVSTLFPSGVITVQAVDKIELVDELVYTAAYTINTIDQPIKSITFHVTSPQGSYHVDDKGRYQVLISPYRVQYREKGTSTWTWWDEVINASHAVPTTQSTTYTQGITAGPIYEARVARLDPKLFRTNYSNDLYFTGLTATEANTTAKETTRLAIKIRASNALGNAALSKLNILVQRRLSQWNGSSWPAPANTNKAVWAFADMCKANYGGSHANELIDLDHLLALEAANDEFSAIYDSKVTLWSALNDVARVMGGRAVQLPGGIYSVVQDIQRPPVALYTMRNIVKGSYGVVHSIPTDSDVNFVRVTYKNEEENYRETSVDCVPYLITPREPYEVRLRGCTKNDVAYDIGLKMANENLWRRARCAFTTTLEGFIPVYGDTIRVGHYVVGLEQTVNSISGEVMSNEGTMLKVWEDLSELVGEADTQLYLMDIDGSPYGPISCDVFSHSDGYNRVLLSTSPPANIMVYGDDHQGPKFAAGSGSDFLQEVKVTKVNRVSGKAHQVRIEGVIDHPGAYAGDDAVDYSPIPPPIDASPKIESLFAELYGADGNVKARLTWVGRYADYYIVDMSLDGGATSWSILGRPTEPHFNAILPQVDGITIRVRGVSLFVGNALTVVIDVLSREITYPGVFDLRPATPFIGNLVSVEWQQLPRGSFALIQFMVLGEVLKETRVDETVNSAMITRDEIMAVYAQSIQGQLFPAVGCREVTVRMYGLAKNNGVWIPSPEYTELVMTNEPMLGVHDLRFRELQTSLSLSFKWPDPSPGGVYVYMSTTTGFIPSLANMVFFGTTNALTLTNVLIYPESYFIVIAAFDSWGPDQLVFSPEYRIDTTQAGDYVLPPITHSMLAEHLGWRIDRTDGGYEEAYSGGLVNQWTLKVQSSNGYVAGFGLAVTDNDDITGGQYSEFFVLVDRFGVAAPGASHLSFLIEDGQVRMPGARIANASINNASIGNIIESTNWDPDNKSYGWHIDKTGAIEATQIIIRDRNGDTVLDSGLSESIYGPSIGNLYNGEAALNSDPDFNRVVDYNGGFSGGFSGAPLYNTTGSPSLGSGINVGWICTMDPGAGFIDEAQFATIPGETLFFAMKSFHGVGSDSTCGVLVQCFDVNMNVNTPEFVWAVYSTYAENNSGYELFTDSLVTPDDCSWMRIRAFNGSSAGTFSLSHVGVSRAPMELTYHTLPTYIRDLSIDTLSIAGGAVTAISTDYGGAATTTSSWLTVAQITDFDVVGGSIKVDWGIGIDGANPSSGFFERQMRITIDGVDLPAPYDVVVVDRWNPNTLQFESVNSYQGVNLITGLSIGLTTIRMQIRSGSGVNGLEPHAIKSCSLFATETKK